MAAGFLAAFLATFLGAAFLTTFLAAALGAALLAGAAFLATARAIIRKDKD